MTYSIERGISLPVEGDGGEPWFETMAGDQLRHSFPYPAAVYSVGDRLFPLETITSVKFGARSIAYTTRCEYADVPEEYQ